MENTSVDYSIKLFGVVTAIGVAIWRFIRWTFGVSSRLQLLEEQYIADCLVREKIQNTLNAVSNTVVSLETKVDLLVDNKIK